MGLKENVNLLEMPDTVPQRGNRFTRFMGQVYMAAIGWRLAGEVPDLAKFVLVLAPHTSNVDFLVGIGPLFALGLRLSFMAKSALFWEPFGTYLRWVGAVPVKRSAGGGAVREALAQFEERDKFILLITPEGTRKKVTRWKSGFHRIARKAGVPIVPLTFDYSRREYRFGTPLTPTADMDADIKTLQAFFSADQARNPDQF